MKKTSAAILSDASKSCFELVIPEISGFDRGYVAEKIIGATEGPEGSIVFLVKWEDQEDVELVTNVKARQHCPQLVIKFYEQNIQWQKS